MEIFELTNEGYMKTFNKHKFMDNWIAFSNINGTTNIVVCDGDDKIKI